MPSCFQSSEKFKCFSFTVKQQGLLQMKFKVGSEPQFFKERTNIWSHQVLLDEPPLQNAVGLPGPQAQVPGCFSKPGILTGLIQEKLTAGRMGNVLIWAPLSPAVASNTAAQIPANQL